jgi:hypothetical protein
MGKIVNHNILLVEPNFPIAAKSKNHSQFLPIGILKLASYYRKRGYNIRLNRGNHPTDFIPSRILITSLFTYWAEYVRDSVQYYKNLYPDSIVVVGGIYASLMPDHCKEYTKCDKVFIGQHKSADKCRPAYDLVEVDYQILHGMRGCTRNCSFCGIWRLEKKSFKTAQQIRNEIESNNLVFYDNNFLANPHIEDILKMLAVTKFNDKVIKCDCQSGFDGRILEEKPHLAKLLKKARFSNVRIAWDFHYKDFLRVENWISILRNAGYNERTIFIFMIYNWNFDYSHMELKRQKCFEWNIQIADCRYRPLDSIVDDYNGNIKDQQSTDYYIHEKWSDFEIKLFRRNVRQHNICIRYKISWENYSRKLETEYARHKFNEEIA